jgi:hypothetical protein
MSTLDMPFTPNTTPKQDMRALTTLKKSGDISPIANLSISQLFEIERLAGIGRNVYQIGQALQIPQAIWLSIFAANTEAQKAFDNGYNDLGERLSETAIAVALAGDAGMLRFALERHGGPQWRAPKDGPMVIVNTPGAVVDVGPSVREGFNQQRLLHEEEAEEATKNGSGS